MSVIDCPCGQDCWAGVEEEDRHFAEETLHWKMSALKREAKTFGGLVGDRIVRGIEATEKRMVTARNRFIERVMGYDKGSLD